MTARRGRRCAFVALTGLLLAVAPGCGAEEPRRDSPLIADHAGDVELYRQLRVEYTNPSWRGNPFDVELTGRFTHAESGRSLTQLGFYAGDESWEIHFMPDRLGEWTFMTRSSDPDLDLHGGSFTAVPSDLPGRLETDGIRWRLSEHGPVAPILLAAGPLIRAEPIATTRPFVDWARDTAGARLIGTTLLNFGPAPYTLDQADRMYDDGEEGERFHLPAWDRSNAFYDAVRDRGMGHYILIYSDDEAAPDRNGLPQGRGGSIGRAELRLFRYLVARFAAYPIVMWDTGIDIGENRSDRWIENFVAWFRANDPWQHPIASRTGGGSGGTHPPDAAYYSDGLRVLPDRSTLIQLVTSRSVPTALTDRYREDYPSPFDGGREKVRRAAWQMLLTYGTAVYFGGSDGGGYLAVNYAADLEAGPDLGRVSRFAEHHIAHLGGLVPADDLVTAADGEVMLSRAGGEEYVAYVLSGSAITVDLSDTTGELDVAWYDPLGGERTAAGRVTGGAAADFTTPGTNAGGTGEWVLHLRSGGGG
jgi:hypothetical protein